MYENVVNLATSLLNTAKKNVGTSRTCANCLSRFANTRKQKTFSTTKNKRYIAMCDEGTQNRGPRGTVRLLVIFIDVSFPTNLPN